MNTTIFNNQQLIPYDIINLCILFFHEHENKQNYYKKSWYAVENNYIQNTFILHQCKFQFNHSINEYSNWSFTLLSLPQTNNSKLQIGFIVLYYEIYYDNNKLLDIDIARFHQKNDKKEAALPVCLNTHITHNNFINPNFTKINLFAKLIRIEYKKYTNFRYCELNPIILMPINIKYEWILQNAYHNQNVFSSKFGNKFYWILIGTLHIDGFYVYLRLLSLPINVSCIKVKLKYVTNIIKNRKMFETKIVKLRYCKTEGGSYKFNNNYKKKQRFNVQVAGAPKKTNTVIWKVKNDIVKVDTRWVYNYGARKATHLVINSANVNKNNPLRINVDICVIEAYDNDQNLINKKYWNKYGISTNTNKCEIGKFMN